MKRLMMILFAVAFTSGMAFAQSNEADVEQVGDNQTATVTQDGSSNDADVDQFTDNEGLQTATVIQDGSSNEATVSQNQTGGGGNGQNTAFIEQIGTSNIANQSTNAPGYNGGQDVWGLQDGEENDLSQTIQAGYTNSLKAEQLGEGNEATQLLSANHSHGEVYQDGNFNVADQKLFGSNNGYMYASIIIDQFGDNNYASQEFTGSGSSHSNNGLIDQDGDENEAFQVGNGRNLDAQLFQTEDNNWSQQDQSGNAHTSIVTQSGNNNKSTVTQSN